MWSFLQKGQKEINQQKKLGLEAFWYMHAIYVTTYGEYGMYIVCAWMCTSMCMVQGIGSKGNNIYVYVC